MYQKCPICDGTGLVSKPPWIAGDQDSWTCSGTGPYPCTACNGTGLLWLNIQLLDPCGLIELVKSDLKPSGSTAS